MKHLLILIVSAVYALVIVAIAYDKPDRPSVTERPVFSWMMATGMTCIIIELVLWMLDVFFQ